MGGLYVFGVCVHMRWGVRAVAVAARSGMGGEEASLVDLLGGFDRRRDGRAGGEGGEGRRQPTALCAHPHNISIKVRVRIVHPFLPKGRNSRWSDGKQWAGR